MRSSLNGTRGSLEEAYCRSPRRGAGEPGLHDRHSHRAGVDQDEASTETARHRTKRPASGEEVEAPVPGLAGGGNHPTDDPFRLLSGIAGLLAPVGGHDRVPPDVRREL